MKKILLTTAALGLSIATSTTANAGVLDGVSVSASTDYVSEYVFRGVSFANTAVQPGIEASVGNFTVGTWASVGLGDSSPAADDEIDVYASYGQNITDKLSGSVGFTIFHFPGLGSDLFDFGGASSFEAFVGLSYDTLLAPSLTGYYDFNLDTFTLEGSIGHSFAVADKTSFDLGLTGGFVTVDDADGYEWATATASVGYAFSDNASIYVGGNFSVNSEDLLDFPDANVESDGSITDIDLGGDDTLFWVGTGFSTSF